jgi:hypothetical protein
LSLVVQQIECCSTDWIHWRLTDKTQTAHCCAEVSDTPTPLPEQVGGFRTRIGLEVPSPRRRDWGMRGKDLSVNQGLTGDCCQSPINPPWFAVIPVLYKDALNQKFQSLAWPDWFYATSQKTGIRSITVNLLLLWIYCCCESTVAVNLLRISIATIWTL